MSDPTPTTPTTPQASSTDPRPGGIAGLRRMSTTAGVGLGEYRAVNPLAVTSVVLGVLGIAAQLHPLALVLPAVGLVLGVVAVLQVRASHGTQAGLWLAVGGMVLCLAIGGFFGAKLLDERGDAERYRGEIAGMFEALGVALAAGDYEAAYEFTSESFQESVTPEQFANVAGLFPRIVRDDEPVFGQYVSARPSQRVKVTLDPQTNRPYAETELIFTFETGEQDRQRVELVRVPAGWRISEFGRWRFE